MYLPYISLYKSGDPVRAVGNVQDHNRVANILNDIEGIGCHVEKPTNGEGRGWKIVVDKGQDRYVAVDTGNTPGYLAAQFADTAASDSLSLLVYRDTVQGSTPNQKVRLFVTDTSVTTIINKYFTDTDYGWDTLAGPPAYVLGMDTAGNVGWMPVDSFACPET